MCVLLLIRHRQARLGEVKQTTEGDDKDYCEIIITMFVLKWKQFYVSLKLITLNKYSISQGRGVLIR